MFHELHWGLPIIGYLFLAGVGAGAVLVSASVALGAGAFGRSRFAIARYGAFIGPLPVIVGTAMIVFEIGRPLRILNLFKLINWSPMSIGAWFVGLFIIVATVYALTYLPRRAHFGDRLEPIRRTLAWICVPFAFGVAVYTAVLLGAMPARPFWNSPVIALLFVLSALSGGIASIGLALAVFKDRRAGGDSAAGTEAERDAVLLGKTESMVLIGELVAIVLFILFAYLSINNAREAIAVIMAGGPLAVPFWGLVVVIGILLPALLELSVPAPEGGHRHALRLHRVAAILAPAAVLTGGFALRYIVVVAGQITGPVGV